MSGIFYLTFQGDTVIILDTEDIAYTDKMSLVTSIADSGRVLIPAEVRKLLNLNVGDTLILQVVNGEIHLIPQSEAILRAKKLVKQRIPATRSLSQELIEERRREARGENLWALAPVLLLPNIRGILR